MRRYAGRPAMTDQTLRAPAEAVSGQRAVAQEAERLYRRLREPNATRPKVRNNRVEPPSGSLASKVVTRPVSRFFMTKQRATCDNF